MANETILRNGLISKAASEVEATLGVRGLQMLNSSNVAQYTFPTTDGSANYILTTNGAGTVTWAANTDTSGFLTDITAESIHDLNDVESATGIVSGDVLQWSGSIWEHVAASSIGTTTLEGLTDTTSDVSSNAGTGNFLRWDGSDWDHDVLAAADIAEGFVTQHEAAIEITVSQVTDFDPTDYVTTTDANSTYVLQSSVGANNGVASLDGNGLVPSTQLPSYVDDVIEFDQPLTTPGSPVTGDLPSGETAATGKIYVDTATNDVYRWSGSAFVNITDFATPDHNISTHGDVNITAIAADEVLQWSGSEWQNQTLAELGMSVDDLTDVDITSSAPTTGQVLAWDGTSKFEPTSISALSQADSVGSLTDTTITGTPADNELLAYDDTTSEWINQTAAEAGLAVAGHTHTHDDITDFDTESAAIADTQIAAADIQDLNNVTNIGTNGQFLQTNGTNATFVTLDHDDIDDFDTEVDAIVDTVIAATDVEDLNNVTGTASEGDVLVYTSSVWTPTTLAVYKRNSKTVATNAADTLITENTVSSYGAVTVEYSISDGTNMRIGQLMAITNGSTTEITDISTSQIGADATEPNFTCTTTGSNIVIKIVNGSGYTVKTAHMVVNA